MRPHVHTVHTINLMHFFCLKNPFVYINRGEFGNKLQKMLDQIFKTLKSQVGLVRYYFLDASKTKPDGTRKNSAHIICVGEKYILQSPTQGRAFVQRLSDIFEDEFDIVIDEKIYTRNRCFRMIDNSKFGQQRPLKGLAWTMENWVSTLVQPVKTLGVASSNPLVLMQLNVIIICGWWGFIILFKNTFINFNLITCAIQIRDIHIRC